MTEWDLKEAIMSSYIKNGEIVKNLDEEIKKGNSIYEVLRVKDGIPLYELEHINRLKASAEKMNFKNCCFLEDMWRSIDLLIEHEKIENNNLKIVVHMSEEENCDWYIYAIESFYPNEELYETGIHTILINEERENPNVKYVNMDFKSRIKEELNKNDAFEALLVNHEGRITEGSRSNMFFVKNKKIYTAPSGEVLMGITREKVLEVCKKQNIDVEFEDIKALDLNEVDAVFMTGTSVDVLPVKSVGEIKFDSSNNEIGKKLLNGYREDVKMDLKLRRKKREK